MAKAKHDKYWVVTFPVDGGKYKLVDPGYSDILQNKSKGPPKLAQVHTPSPSSPALNMFSSDDPPSPTIQGNNSDVEGGPIILCETSEGSPEPGQFMTTERQLHYTEYWAAAQAFSPSLQTLMSQGPAGISDLTKEHAEEFTNDPAGIRAKINEGVDDYQVTGGDMPTFLYKDPEKYDPEDMLSGFILEEVTVPMMVYIAIQNKPRFALSSQQMWSGKDGTFNYEDFMEVLLSFFEHDEDVAFWQRSTRPTRASQYTSPTTLDRGGSTTIHSIICLTHYRISLLHTNPCSKASTTKPLEPPIDFPYLRTSTQFLFTQIVLAPSRCLIHPHRRTSITSDLLAATDELVAAAPPDL
ncbi:hypothetical protein EI94DRAFT_1708102 [Lactarius quietus]|nr:hypothetical protein EI94DRAFT_1708102 [Lactarius quietus]